MSILEGVLSFGVVLALICILILAAELRNAVNVMNDNGDWVVRKLRDIAKRSKDAK